MKEEEKKEVTIEKVLKVAGVTLLITIAGVGVVKYGPRLVRSMNKNISPRKIIHSGKIVNTGISTNSSEQVVDKLTKVENYVTPIDRQKIDLALKRNIVDDATIKRAMTSFELGLDNVDRLLSVSSRNGKGVIKSFPNWKDYVQQLSHEQFKEVVRRAAENYSRVNNVEVVGNVVQFRVKSNSGKSSWLSHLDFFKDNVLTLDCNYDGYEGAGIPIGFANEIRKQMKYMIETELIA